MAEFLRSLFDNSTFNWIIRIVMTGYVIFNGRKNPRSSIIWILMVNIFFIPGLIFFFLLGRDTRESKMFALKKEDDDTLMFLSGLQYDEINREGYRYNQERVEDYKDLINLNLNSDNSYFTDDNKVEFFFWGKDKFEALIEDIKKARKSIDIQYYIFRSDNLGKRIISLLEEKAREGVDVRFLYDGFGGRTLRRKYIRALRDSGVQVAAFFPSILGILNPRINYRNHRKIVVIDDQVAYLGGFNVGDEYLGKTRRFEVWRDTHSRISGGAVFSLKLRFLKDWYYASGQEPNLEEDISPGFQDIGNSSAQIISSGPDTRIPNVRNAMISMINHAKEEIYIQSPYFVLDQSMLDALKMAIIRGLTVNIMLPKNADHLLVHWCSMSFAKELANYGANIYAYQTGFMHSKLIFIDDIVSTFGSTNLDERSFTLNFETNIVVYDKEVNDKLRKQFEIDLESCKQLTVEHFKKRSLFVRAREPIARLFSPIL